jgi:hypothetical protein
MPADDLKWFGEGFDGFPKHLPEDCIEYTLFILSQSPKSAKETRAQLEEVRKAAIVLTTKLLKDYIWQRDSFNLEIVAEDGLHSSCATLISLYGPD